MEDILLTLIIIAATWKWGAWRQWKQYYPTILFLALGNFIYLFLAGEKPLWKFSTIIPTQLAELLMSFVIFPCVILLFLPHFPQKSTAKKILYISLWVFIFSLIEWLAINLNRFIYFNGWKFLYSVIFNIGMFTLLQIHHKNPYWAWIISFFAGLFIVVVFRIPLNSNN